VLWDSSALYILAKITDDMLHDHYSDPLTGWWKDDCLEIFLDEDFSGGDHKHSYNAFAYHISQFYDVVDLGDDGNPHLYNDDIEVKMTCNEHVYTWEVKVPLYTDAYVYGESDNPTRKIQLNDTIGFSIAYCDNDGGNDRESFMGSVEIEGDNNVSWKNADVFGALVLDNAMPEINAYDPINAPDNCSVSIYPNPVFNLLYINRENKKEMRLRIYSTDGKLVISRLLQKDQQNIEVVELPVGFYYFHLRDNDGRFYKGKFIKKKY
jgi:hypothetical protein